MGATRFMKEIEVFSCPLCNSLLNERTKGSATLFTCPKCEFKILTTKELFTRCFRKQTSDSPLCPNCGIKIGEELKFYGDICERCYFFSGFNKQNGTRLLAKGVERS